MTKHHNSATLRPNTKLSCLSMENKKNEAEVREVIVHDLTQARTFQLKGEAGFKIRSLKQKVGDVSFQINEEASITATATTFKLATEIDEVQIVVPTSGKWMMTYPDTFEFEADEPGVADLKVIINRQPPEQKRERRPRINRDGNPHERSYRPREERTYRPREERSYRSREESPLDHIQIVSGRKYNSEEKY